MLFRLAQTRKSQRSRSEDREVIYRRNGVREGRARTDIDGGLFDFL